MKADELQGIGCEADEPKNTAARFEMIWEEEIKKEDANLVMAMIRFVTIRRLTKLVAWSVVYEVRMDLGPPLAIRWSINYATCL